MQRMADLRLTSDPDENFSVYVRKIQEFTTGYDKGFDYEDEDSEDSEEEEEDSEDPEKEDEDSKMPHFDGFDISLLKYLRIGKTEFLSIFESDETKKLLETFNEQTYAAYLTGTQTISDTRWFLFFVYWHHFRETLRPIENSLLDYLVAKKKNPNSRYHRDECQTLMAIRTKSLEPLINKVAEHKHEDFWWYLWGFLAVTKVNIEKMEDISLRVHKRAEAERENKKQGE